MVLRFLRTYINDEKANNSDCNNNSLADIAYHRSLHYLEILLVSQIQKARMCRKLQ